MLKHYFLIIYRNMLKSKSTFIINLVGLSIGLACVLLIYLWVNDEIHIDKFHKNDDQLFQVMEVSKANDKINVGTGTQGLLAETMSEELPEVEAATTFFSFVNEGYSFNLKNSKDEIIKAGGVFADEKFFDMFSYTLIEGQASQVLKDKNSVVISKSLAGILFGLNVDPVGKSFEWEIVGKKGTAKVSGVFEDVPANSTQKFDFVGTKAALFELIPNFTKWYNEGSNTFLLLKKGTNVVAFNKKIKDFVKKYSDRFTLFVRPYSSAYLYGNYENGVQAGGRIEYVRLFSIIGFLILVIACINFINLSTATAATREKEIGVKKAVGSARRDLILQFLIESVFTVLVALIFAIGLVWLLTPQFNQITGKSVSLHLSPLVILYLAGGAVLTGILSGYYPAFYLSGISTISVLKGKRKTSFSELMARKGLVVFQFVISLFLIVSVLVIYRQVQFIQTMNLGYDRDNVIYVEKEGPLMENSESFLNRVRELPGIAKASAINGSIAQGADHATTTGMEWPGKQPDRPIVFSIKTVDYDLLETLGISMAEGRSFSRNFGAEENNLIFNETAIKAMGLEKPIGKTVNLWGKEMTIIGIAKDFFAN
ncbi:MAG: ABC transporter permease, partial [Calditrichaeota bacterium]|nr:ABC transporter permease [Calditrichota bacterium]